MYIQHWGEMFATWETSDFLFGTLSKKKKKSSRFVTALLRGADKPSSEMFFRAIVQLHIDFPPEVTLSIRT